MLSIRILIVEDDQSLAEGVKFDLEAEGYIVDISESAEAAVKRAEKELFDLFLLDVNLPDKDGFSLIRELKAIQDSPTIFLTARDLEEDQIYGFDIGADDYVTKPFSMPILRKRIASLLKRNAASEIIYDDGFFRIDFNTLEARLGEKKLTFSRTELKVLRYFILNGGIVLTRQMLLENLWDIEGRFVDEHALTVTVGRLRSKIENDYRQYIETVYGIGYKWIGKKI